MARARVTTPTSGAARPRATAKPAARPRPRTSAKKSARRAASGSAVPRRAGAAADPLARIRALCLGLPEATEKEAWGTPTFRVRDKMFAMYVDDHHGDGRTAIWCKAPLGFQEMMVGTDGDRFFVPPYVGVKGWIGVRLDRPSVDWEEVLAILEDGYRMTAPDRLAALLDARLAG